MPNADTLTLQQIEAFLEGSAGIELVGQDRAEGYGWVQGVLVAQEFAGNATNSEAPFEPFIE